MKTKRLFHLNLNHWIKFFLLFQVLFLRLEVNAQVCNGVPFISNVCATASVSVGTQTDVGTSYTWLKDGAIKKGPLAGDGQAISFDFAINVLGDTGIYTIEKNVNGVITCASKIKAVLIPLPVSQTLTGGGQVCNATKSLSLSGSENGVTYELYRNNSYVGNDITGTGGAISFAPEYQPGTYTVKAYKNVCSGFGNSYIMFGNQVLSNNINNITVNYTTTNTANVSWSGSGNFIVEYGLAGFTPGSGATAGAGGAIINASSSPININALSAGTSYDVYVRQLCSPGNYTYGSSLTNFKTDCATISSFPFTQGFETTNDYTLPACWSGTYAFTETGHPRTGSKSLSANPGAFFILPRMSLNGGQQLKYFIETNYFSTIYQMKISTTDNSASSFTTTILTDTVLSQTYIEKVINLSGYSGAVYIKFIIIDRYSNFDDFIVENRPVCSSPSDVRMVSSANTSATISWSGTGTFIAEYGAAGFTPGTGATNGTGGTLINNATSPLSISPLTAGGSYDIYFRQNCTATSGGYSPNSAKFNFNAFPGCAAPIVISNCTNIVATIPAGPGLLNFAGSYPNNSAGTPTSGKEILYSFTPSVTGVYYIDVSSSTGFSSISFLYKPASSGCSNSGWIGIYSGYNGVLGKFPIGMLQAGVQYYIMLDNELENTITQNFKICKANVGSGDFCATSTVKNIVPAFSTKKEYLLDGNGNLVAELDFSNVSNAVGTISYSAYINTSGTVRRDGDNKEYLNRNFKITTTNQPANAIGIKLYFTNAELQALINEPNDMLADVTNINDLNISLTSNNGCSDVVTYSALIQQTGNGSYDPTASYVQFSTTDLSSFYLHGGAAGLSSSQRSVCPNSTVLFSIYPLGAGFTYQWQVDNGSGFVNLNNVNNFSGVTTTTLSVNGSTSFYGYKFRCIATDGGTVITGKEVTLKFSLRWSGTNDNNWLNPRNWGCSSTPALYSIPDQFTDVIVDSYVNNFPEVSGNAVCRSLTEQTGATITVLPGARLDVKGK